MVLDIQQPGVGELLKQKGKWSIKDRVVCSFPPSVNGSQKRVKVMTQRSSSKGRSRKKQSWSHPADAEFWFLLQPQGITYTTRSLKCTVRASPLLLFLVNKAFFSFKRKIILTLVSFLFLLSLGPWDMMGFTMVLPILCLWDFETSRLDVDPRVRVAWAFPLSILLFSVRM